jgi:hypothetical protein
VQDFFNNSFFPAFFPIHSTRGELGLQEFSDSMGESQKKGGSLAAFSNENIL